MIVAGMVLSQYAVGDRMSEAHAMVSLVEQGWADQIEVARAFAYSVRTVRRHQRRFEDGGLSALGHGRGFPAGRTRLRGRRVGLIHRLKADGHSNREIARRIGVNERAIRKTLRRIGWKSASAPETGMLPLEEALPRSSSCGPKPVRFFSHSCSNLISRSFTACGPKCVRFLR
ncbi:MAG: helix-turn-helix domain-containing protein [Verrucomicrobiae bacterium]|nr:helix-turn-helix domain-containing protein [Verrucomicrobiae bacterium]